MVQGNVQPAYRIKELRSLAVSEDPNRHDRATGGAHRLWNGHPLRDRQRFLSDVIWRSAGGPDHKEVAGQHGAGVVAKKRRPGLRRLTAAAGTRPTRHVAANRARRHGETELQSELRRDPLLTRCRDAQS
jgi:hypothetical protein